MMKKILAAMLVLCTLATSFSSLAVGVSAARSVQLDEAVNEQLAAEAADIESAMPDRAGALAGAQSGKCGDDLTWTLDDNGTLTVSGTGAMYDYTYSYTSTPWYAYRNTIKKIVISSGVTGIGGYAFRNHTSLETVTMADSVTVINNGAFDKCTSLVSVTIGNAVTRLGDYCFNDCESLVS
ncbi:MAG: leucine-rich repeat domain-containing protein, partial [Clostridia bacterium]|nr:leucine-rich repeat domain-containing protein [Clostridia bacterium]